MKKNSESALYREISVVPEPGVKYIAADGTEQNCTEWTPSLPSLPMDPQG